MSRTAASAKRRPKTAKAPKSRAASTYATEIVEVGSLKPHPRNYRAHPDDQLAHIEQSIREHGVYRNVVVARDGTILAGHGVVAAATRMGLTKLPVIRLDLDPAEPRALKLVVGDNELGHLAEIDDRMLSEILREVKNLDVDGLIGTGYDEMMLANLVYVTRPEGEVKDANAAAEWIGMPAFATASKQIALIVSCATEADRDALLLLLGNPSVYARTKYAISIRWPDAKRRGKSAVQFEECASGGRSAQAS